MSEHLRCYTQQKPSSWAQLLPHATFAYNISVNTTTGFSPFELIYGRNVTLPDTINKRKPVYNYDNFTELIRKELHNAWQFAAKMNDRMKENNKKYYDRRTNEIEIKPGDRIMVKKLTRDKKFGYVWNGPYQVISVHGKRLIYKDNNKTKSIGFDYVKLTKNMKCFNF